MGLGSNLGDPPANLNEAERRIAGLTGVRLAACSRIWLTEPQGFKEQPWFANRVLRLECAPEWTPEALLDALLRIECDMGRQRGVRFGPRNIDVDLLLFDERVMATESLILPHPRIRVRAFVLIPLREVAGNLIFPDGDTVDQALDRLRFTISGERIRQE